MAQARTTTASGDALGGVVPGIAVLAVLFLLLRVAGLTPLAACVIADAVGVSVAVMVCRRQAGDGAASGLAVVLVIAFSLLVGVLAEFLLAVAGLG